MDDIDKFIVAAIKENDVQQQVAGWLDTGYPPLNKAVSGRYDGGLPMGRVIEIFGPSSSGKTAVATEAMIAAQRAGGLAIFMDHENSFDVGLAEDLGLDPSTRWVYKQPTTFEESVDLVTNLAIQLRGVDEKTLRPKRGVKAVLPMDKPIVVVFDSLASMVPQSKMFDKDGNLKDLAETTMHDNMALAKATSGSFPKLAQIAYKCNVCMIFLNQVRTKPGVMYGDPTTTPGGNAPEYYASVRIGLARELIKDKGKQVIGQIIKANVKKNKVSAPFRTAEWNFMFRPDGSGYFDVEGSLVEHLAERGILTRDGNGYIWTDGKKYMMPALKEKINKEGLRSELMRLLEGSGIGEEEADIELVGGEE